MNLKKYFQNFWPYFIPIVLFILISYIYFNPVLDGKDLPQGDNTHAIGAAQELVQFEKATGKQSMWTNSMFSGMPAYQIKGGKSSNIFYYIHSYIRFNMPYTTVAIVFIYLLGFYILMLSLKFDKWLSFLGSIAFAFASFNFIIISAGHITQAYAIGYMPIVIAGILLTYNKKYILGGVITTLGLGVELAANHPQIAYYLFISLLVFAIVKLIFAIREKELRSFLISSAVVGAAAILAILPSSQQLSTTYEYGEQSNRGKSNLVTGNAKVDKSSGLDKNYAFGWSYGKPETFTLMIPNVVGGASGSISQNEKALNNVQDEYKQMVGQNNHYWGDQPFTSGPVYLGAIIMFLFFLGAFYYAGPLKWWLLSATLLSILLSWGRNFPAFNDFVFYNFPLYNKFRTVAMTLVIAGLTVPLLGMLGLKTILDAPEILKTKKWPFWVSLGLTAGMCVLFAIMPKLFFDFITWDENRQILIQKQQQPEYVKQFDLLIENLGIARISILKADAWRSFGFIVAGAGFIYFAAIKKLKVEIVAVVLSVLVLADLWSVDKRYLSSKDFVDKTQMEQAFTPSKADEFIMKDVDINYRVFNISANPFTEVNTSYFHKSIGGYHGAKLRRYQDLIDNIFDKDINNLRGVLSKTQRYDSITMEFSKMHALNMLNTKYIIYNPEAMPLVNMYALGNAWFVQEIKTVKTANEEIEALKDFNPATTAIMNEKEMSKLGNFKAMPFDTAKIPLIQEIRYEPNSLIYQVNSKRDELAVFSEVYFDKGWQAYLNNKPVDHFRVNYILRGMVIPAGRHMLEFKFEPKTHTLGGKISYASSVLVIFVILGAIAKGIRDLIKKQPEVVAVVDPPAHDEHHDKKSKKK